MKYFNISTIFFCFIIALVPQSLHADWRHTLYGAVPEDCAKINAPEEKIYRCREESTYSQDVITQLSKLDEFLEDDKEAQLDARYEVALLRKLADPRASSILEAISEFSLLTKDSGEAIHQSYQQLPLKCIQSMPQVSSKFKQHETILKSITPQQIQGMKDTRIAALIEDLSYMAQLREARRELSEKMIFKAKTTEERNSISQTIKGIDEALKTLPLKDPLLSSNALKNFERHPKFSTLLTDPEKASTSTELHREIAARMKQGSEEMLTKLSEGEETGLGYLCQKMQGDLEDLVYHRFARGVKEADFIDSLLSQEDELNHLTNHRLATPAKTKDEQADQIAYYGRMGSAACRLKLKVINNSSVDLAREFAINAGLTIGTAGLSSVATGLSVGSKVVVAANTGRAGRFALAGITAVDFSTAAFMEAPQVYESCIKGSVAQDHYFINSNITPFSCGMSITLTTVSRSLGVIGAKNTIKAFKNAKTDRLYLDAVRTNIAAQGDDSLKEAFVLAQERVAKLTPDELTSVATQIGSTSVKDPKVAREIVLQKYLVESLPLDKKLPLLRQSLQSSGGIPPKGTVPRTLSEVVEESPTIDISRKAEAVSEAVDQTALSPQTASDMLSQGHVGELPLPSSSIQTIKQSMKLSFKFSNIIDDSKSASFLTRFQKDSAEQRRALFFNVENTVQKQLNDLYIVDKEVVDSLNDTYKQMIYEQIRSNKHLSRAIIGEFNDFKSLKLAFDKSITSPNVLNSELNNIFKKVNNDFAAYCEKLGIKQLLTKDGAQVKGMVGNPRHWFIAGTADSVDLSSIFSRLSKGNYRADRSSTLITAKHQGKELKELAVKTEDLRHQAEAILKDQPLAMKDGILDEELVAILRKSGQKGYGDQYFEAVRQKAKASYPGLELNNQQISTLRSYYNAADTFSPPVLSAQRVVHNLDQATGDVVSFDYRGIGALNGQANMQALKDWNSQSLDDLSKLIRQHDDSVTNRLVQLREKATTQSIKQAFHEVDDLLPNWESGNITYSGDDGILKIPAEVKSAYLKKFGSAGEQKYKQALDDIYQRAVANLQGIGERADRVRITRLHAPDMRNIGHQEIGEQISKQESIEKGIREFLKGKIQQNEDVLIAVESKVGVNGSISYTVIDRNAKDPKLIHELIEEYMKSNQIPQAIN